MASSYQLPVSFHEILLTADNAGDAYRVLRVDGISTVFLRAQVAKVEVWLQGSSYISRAPPALGL